MGIVEKIKAGELDEVALLEYVTDNDVNIAIAVAASELATEPILDIAAHDNDKRVRLAAVNNPNTGIDALKFLCKDIDTEIAETAASRLGRG